MTHLRVCSFQRSLQSSTLIGCNYVVPHSKERPRCNCVNTYGKRREALHSTSAWLTKKLGHVCLDNGRDFARSLIKLPVQELVETSEMRNKRSMGKLTFLSTQSLALFSTYLTPS